MYSLIPHLYIPMKNLVKRTIETGKNALADSKKIAAAGSLAAMVAAAPADAALITLTNGTSYKIDTIVFNVLNGIENGGDALALINAEADANGDPISSLGQLVFKTKAIVDYNTFVDDWVETDVYDTNGNKYGTLDAGIDWLSYRAGYGTDGMIQTNIGEFSRGGSSVYAENLSAVPAPGALPMMATGLAMIAGLRRMG